jgi:hypothetical protein
MIAIAVNTAGMNLSDPRLRIAAESRQDLEDRAPVRFHEVGVARSAQTAYGYHRHNPFLRDLLQGVREAAPEAAWWGYVHADIVFTPEVDDWVRRHERQGHRVLAACRLNVGRTNRLAAVQATRARESDVGQGVGVELVLVHTEVYGELMSRLPDVVVGIDAWGLTFRAAARGLKLHFCDSPVETPLRHVAHPDHPGAKDSLVRQLNFLMLKAARRAGKRGQDPFAGTARRVLRTKGS